MTFNPKLALQRIRHSHSKTSDFHDPPQVPEPLRVQVHEPPAAEQSFESELPSFNKSSLFPKDKMSESIIYGNKLSERVDESNIEASRDWELKSRVVELERVVGQLQDRLVEERQNTASVRREKSHLQTSMIKLEYENSQLKSDKTHPLKQIRGDKTHPLKQITRDSNGLLGGRKSRDLKVETVKWEGKLKTFDKDIKELGRLMSDYPSISKPLIRISNRY